MATPTVPRVCVDLDRCVLKPAGIDKSVGIMSIQFLKDASDPRWADNPGMRQYLAFLKEYQPKANPNDFIVAYEVHSDSNVRAGLGASRRRPDPRECHATSVEPERLGTAAASAWDRDQHEPDQFLSNHAGRNSAASTAFPGSCLAACLAGPHSRKLRRRSATPASVGSQIE
jgi:hypothetical protein